MNVESDLICSPEIDGIDLSAVIVTDEIAKIRIGTVQRIEGQREYRQQNVGGWGKNQKTGSDSDKAYR